MAKQVFKEQAGATRPCDGCGKSGRERLRPGVDDVPPVVSVKKWCCSATCAEKVMKQPDWGCVGWLK